MLFLSSSPELYTATDLTVIKKPNILTAIKNYAQTAIRVRICSQSLIYLDLIKSYGRNFRGLKYKFQGGNRYSEPIASGVYIGFHLSEIPYSTQGPPKINTLIHPP
jgi:hypothetical protein